MLIFIWSIFGINCIPTGILNIPRHPYASETLLYSFRCVSNSVVAIMRLINNHYGRHVKLFIIYFFIKNNHMSIELTHWSYCIIFKHQDFIFIPLFHNQWIWLALNQLTFRTKNVMEDFTTSSHRHFWCTVFSSRLSN